MPKKDVEVVKVNKRVFSYILKKKGSSIRKLGEEPDIHCSEKTIRRELNDKGGLRPQYVKQIARYLNVDSRLLTGEMLKKGYRQDGSGFRYYCSSPLDHIEDFPFFHEEHEKLMSMEETMGTIYHILSMFRISSKQFQDLDFDAQYCFQYDLFSAIVQVICKHFDRDGFGNETGSLYQETINELEDYKETHDIYQHANTVLREEFLRKLPLGYSRDKIKKMSAEELIALKLELEYDHDEDYFKDKYEEHQ